MSVLDGYDRHVGRNGPRIAHKRRRFRQDRLERSFVIEEFIQPAPDRLTSSAPRSLMSVCWPPVCTTVMPDFSRTPSGGMTPGSVLNFGSFERNDRILNVPSVINGTRRLSSVTTFLIRS